MRLYSSYGLLGDSAKHLHTQLQIHLQYSEYLPWQVYFIESNNMVLHRHSEILSSYSIINIGNFRWLKDAPAGHIYDYADFSYVIG